MPRDTLLLIVFDRLRIRASVYCNPHCAIAMSRRNIRAKTIGPWSRPSILWMR